MKRPFELIRDATTENLARSREDLKAGIEQAHAFMVWIVGFSVGGLYLIVSNPAKVLNPYSHCLLKTMLILLTTSVVTGIIYRLAIYRFLARYNSVMVYIEGAFSKEEVMSTQVNDLSNETDIMEVARLLKDEFGEDVSSTVDLYMRASDELYKQRLLDGLKMHYNKTGAWAKADLESAIAYSKSVFKTAFGLSDKTVNKAFTHSSTTRMKLWRWVSIISFYLSCIAFVAVPVMICIVY